MLPSYQSAKLYSLESFPLYDSYLPFSLQSAPKLLNAVAMPWSGWSLIKVDLKSAVSLVTAMSSVSPVAVVSPMTAVAEVSPVTLRHCSHLRHWGHCYHWRHCCHWRYCCHWRHWGHCHWRHCCHSRYQGYHYHWRYCCGTETLRTLLSLETPHVTETLRGHSCVLLYTLLNIKTLCNHTELTWRISHLDNLLFSGHPGSEIVTH